MSDAIRKNHLNFMSSGGVMGEQIRNLDWSKNPLGAPENWSQSLQSTVSIMLANRFPMLLWWGPQYISLYNDAYAPIFGTKHPWALGLPVKECWSEVWEVLQPLIDTPFQGGPSTWIEDFLLLINRNDSLEEAHFTVAYSPVPDSSVESGIGGVLASVHEITEKIINERAMGTLRELGAVAFEEKSLDVIYRNLAQALAKNNKDFPFALVYKITGDKNTVTVAASTGININQNVFPAQIEIAQPTEATKDFCEAFSENKIVVSNIIEQDRTFPKGVWETAPTQFVHIPISAAGASHPYCIVSAALNPYRKFDNTFKEFCQLIGERVSIEINKMLALEEEINRSESLAEIDRAKTVFFSNISHEFRTPLTLILGPLEELLKQPESNFSQKNLLSLETTHRNAMRLLKLVNTLLDFSTIESGKQQANFVLTDISSFTNKLAETFQDLMDKAGLKFNINIDIVSQPVYVDKQMWEKIVFNLLSNAFKYTLNGAISLNLTSKNDKVLLEVKDTGTGIPQKELVKIFDRFHRVQGAQGRTHEGSGIGLSFIKELVNLHGGTIIAASEEEKGSTFTVTIPTGKKHLPAGQISNDESFFTEISSNVYLEEAAALLEDVPAKSNLESTLQKDRKKENGTVLIVEDNADMRQYLSTLLEKNYNIVTAENGMDALHKIQNKQPTVVITDMMMPVMDGAHLIHELKSNPATSRLPVIILSARAGEEARIDGYDIGADDYLVKPFSAKELLSRVRAQIKIVKLRNEMEENVRNLFMEAPAMICIFRGPQHVYELANDIYLEVIGNRDVLGQPIRKALPELEGSGIYEILDTVYSTGKPFVGSEVPVKLDRGNGKLEETYFNFVYQPSHNSEGIIEGILVFGVNVTDQVSARRKIEESEKELEQKVIERTEELKEKNTQLKNMNKELEAFTYISSHDLQEPLRKIQTFAGRISEKEEQNLSDQGKDYFARMQDAAKRMQILIQDLLNFSRISNTDRKFEYVDLNAIINEVKEELKEVIETKNAAIEVEILCKPKVISFQFRQLLYNLISNALKFSKSDVPTQIVITSLIAKGSELNNESLQAEKEYFHISVSDNGIGFEEHFSDKIFEVFQRLHDKSKYAGTGIGLAIVKKIVDNHNGIITAKSQLGKGALFDIYLPS